MFIIYHSVNVINILHGIKCIDNKGDDVENNYDDAKNAFFFIVKLQTFFVHSRFQEISIFNINILSFFCVRL